MKKVVMTVVALACAASFVSAQTVSSANIVGYNKVQKPAGQLNIVAAQFASASLDELFSADNFVANLDDTLCDRILEWNGSSYITYGLCDPTLLGQGTEPQWRTVGAGFFVEQTNYVSEGSGLWIQSHSSSTDTNALTLGEVVTAEFMTNSISVGLSLIANPFSSSIDLNTTLTNGTANLDDTLCDRVMVWDVGTQAYITYGLCDPTLLGQGTAPQWRPVGASFFAPNLTLNIPMGQGFWYQAKGPVTWVAENPYFSNL